MLAVIPFKDDDEVVELANNNDLRPGRDDLDERREARPPHRGRRIRAGNVSINFPTVNPPEAPFGGYKQSGMGRELSRHALDLYTQVKNVVVNLNPHRSTGTATGRRSRSSSHRERGERTHPRPLSQFWERG